MESRKASSGNILVILLVIVVLVIALGVIAFKVILPKFTSQLGSQVASQAIQMAVDQIKKMDFSKAETVEINQQLPNPKLSV
ncbi:MAG: hypothetical protein Q7S61_01080, partial [bacterium]|nr:hypothetical protein [bacterium]